MVILLPYKDIMGNLSCVMLVELVSVHAFRSPMCRGCSALKKSVQSGIHAA